MFIKEKEDLLKRDKSTHKSSERHQAEGLLNYIKQQAATVSPSRSSNASANNSLLFPVKLNK